jgi:hypothetical protein
MNNTSKKWDSILRVETIGFSLMIALSWLTELLRVPHLIFGEAFTPNWGRAMIRTVVILGIWLWVRSMTRKLLKRLHYLEEFVRVCGWCRKVCLNDKWVSLEEYFHSNFATRTTHGVCPECIRSNFPEVKIEGEPPKDVKEQRTDNQA